MSQKGSRNALIPEAHEEQDRQINRQAPASLKAALCQIYTKLFIWRELKLALKFPWLQIPPWGTFAVISSEYPTENNSFFFFFP